MSDNLKSHNLVVRCTEEQVNLIRSSLNTKQRAKVLIGFLNKLAGSQKKVAKEDISVSEYPLVVMHNHGGNACKKPIMYIKSIPVAGNMLSADDCVMLNGMVPELGLGLFCSSCNGLVDGIESIDVKERKEK